MLRIVLRALSGTRIADFRAKRAELGSEVTATRHETHCESANIGAIAIQLDATSHHLYILLMQAF